MQQITHAKKRTKPKTRTNIIISVVFHVLLAVGAAYWAAREGMLGAKMKTLSASLLEKEKREAPKKEVAKEVAKEAAKEVQEIKKAVAAQTQDKFIPPPPAADLAAAPPPPVTLGGSDFNFNQSDLNDPVVHYKQQVEAALRAKWNRPSDVLDLGYIAEVEMSIDAAGKILGNTWKKGSGDAKWDDSVRRAVASMTAMNRPPPKGFPDKVLVRFDVQEDTLAIVK